VNNLVSTGKSLATISNGMHPLVIQFPAYQGDTVFKQVSGKDAYSTAKSFRTSHA
jgi:hypothetical protein